MCDQGGASCPAFFFPNVGVPPWTRIPVSVEPRQSAPVIGAARAPVGIQSYAMII